MAKTRPVSVWRQGWQATKQAHHGIAFFYGVEVMMALLGGAFGLLAIPSGASRLDQALYPAIGTVIGIAVGILLLFLFFTVVASVRQNIGTMVTNIVTQVTIQNMTTVVLPYTTPVVVSDAEKGISALRYLLERGTELEPDLSPTGVHRHGWGQMEYWTQQWLDYVTKDVWLFLPTQAAYIVSDEGLHIQNEMLKYMGWQAPLAVRRVVFERRLGRLRQVCSQIQELHKTDSQKKEGV